MTDDLDTEEPTVDRVELEPYDETPPAPECWVCGAAGGPVEVSQVRWGVVAPGKPTSYTEQGIACADHRDDVVRALSDHVIATLDEQTPHHQAIHAKRGEMEEHFRSLRRAARARETVPEDAPADRVADADRSLRMAADALAQADSERRELVETATAAHDARLDALRVSLRQ